MSLLSARERLRIMLVRSKTTHVWERDDKIPGFRCSCGRTMDVMCLVESGYGRAEEIGNESCRLPYRDIVEPYVKRMESSLTGDEAKLDESNRTDALLRDFGVDPETMHRWWHPDAWMCWTCDARGVGGAHVCDVGHDPGDEDGR